MIKGQAKRDMQCHALPLSNHEKTMPAKARKCPIPQEKTTYAAYIYIYRSKITSNTKCNSVTLGASILASLHMISSISSMARERPVHDGGNPQNRTIGEKAT